MRRIILRLVVEMRVDLSKFVTAKCGTLQQGFATELNLCHGLNTSEKLHSVSRCSLRWPVHLLSTDPAS